jgi:glutathione synthase/RimK-type ligase-like ATP-grasp enzyme
LWLDRLGRFAEFTGSSSAIMIRHDKWAPRAAQEERLRRLEHQIAHCQVTIEVEIERAALLSALDRRAEAQQAFVDILLRAPTNFSALNEFGACLTAMGLIAAACRVYSEAIIHHRKNPIGHVNLANLLLRRGNLSGAREHYEAALRLDPNHPQAHQGLGAVHSALGDYRSAKPYFQNGFSNHFISTLPYRGTKPPIPLLLLVSSGSGNIPTASFLDDRIFAISVIVADFLDAAIPLPAHKVVFNGIGDADLCNPALEAAARFAKTASAPVINTPSAVIRTGRASNAQRLRALPGVVTPRTVIIPRAILTGPKAGVTLSADGFLFPLLLRSPGFHTGHHFVFVDSATELPGVAAGLPGDNLFVIEYLDARGADGNSRKYRVMIVDGRIYPMHLAISRQWKVHYFTADMTDSADHRSEDAAFLANMPAVLGQKAMTSLERIAEQLNLDYCGIDFGLSPDGDVLLFEANATMVVNLPDSDERWDYRRPAVAKILSAVSNMILDRAAPGRKNNVA